MVLVAVHLHALDDFLQLSINADVQVAFAAHAFKEFAVMSFTAAYDGSQNHDFPSGIVVPYHVEHAFFRIFHHRFASHVAVGLAGTGIEQSQKVVNLGGGAYGGAGVFVGRLLLNADDGRQTGYLIDIGPFQSAQEVACVGRESLDVAALPFGKDGVEGQA